MTEWDSYLAPAESAGYEHGDVAAAWNEHAAISDAGLDAADDAIAANDEALYDAAAHLGTDPGAVAAAQDSAEASFNATFDAQLESLGLDPHADGAGQGY